MVNRPIHRRLCQPLEQRIGIEIWSLYVFEVPNCSNLQLVRRFLVAYDTIADLCDWRADIVQRWLMPFFDAHMERSGLTVTGNEEHNLVRVHHRPNPYRYSSGWDFCRVVPEES